MRITLLSILLVLVMAPLQAQQTVNVKSLTFSADAVAAVQAFMVTQTTGQSHTVGNTAIQMT